MEIRMGTGTARRHLGPAWPTLCLSQRGNCGQRARAALPESPGDTEQGGSDAQLVHIIQGSALYRL